MTRRSAVLCVLALALPAFGQEEAPRPEPPLDLSAPKTPSHRFGEHDLRTLDGPTLRANAFDAYRDGALREAIQLQHWAVVADGEGQYNLACFYALSDRVEGALYWLQRAAAEEGVDAEWATEDSDLEAVRLDPRWPRLLDHLEAMNAWWAASGAEETLLVVPQGYAPGEPIPVVIGLHGRGSHPRDFADRQAYQAHADATGAAFLGVSGAVPVGPGRYVWSEAPARDAERVTRALAEVADRVTVDAESRVLIGFSQGAQVAVELAAREPERFAGAIVLSPGAGRGSQLDAVEAASPALGERGFVIRVGGGEHPETVALAREDARWLEAAGARVDHHAYPDLAEHRFPPDFEERLGDWVSFVLGR